MADNRTSVEPGDTTSSPRNADYHVVAECPVCPWRSGEYEVVGIPNGEWYARQAAASEYRQHANDHRPLPRFVRIEPS